MRLALRTLVGLIALSSLVFAAGEMSAVSAAPSHSAKATCSGGAIAPGTYTSLKITGVCAIPDGVVVVRGGLRIEQNGLLDAHSPTATLIVYGGATVERNGIFILGCSPAFGCATTTNDRVYGGVRAYAPLALLFHSNTIRGGVKLLGGGGGVNCAPSPLLMGSPIYSTFEDNHISGGVTVKGYESCWFGFIRNTTHGTVTLINNTLADPDAMEVVTNKITGNLVCSGNSPAPQLGDSGGQPNMVTGRKIGQCAHL